MDLEVLIHSFFERLRERSVEVYNEISLQLELGIFLRNALTDWKVQFERPVSFFDLPRHRFVKREIDIVVFKSNPR